MIGLSADGAALHPHPSLRLPATSSQQGRPTNRDGNTVRQIKANDFINSTRESERPTKKTQGGGGDKAPGKLSKSKKRKYASQPRATTKKQKTRGGQTENTLPLMELPMTKIKETGPRMTFYNNAHDPTLPKEINGVQLVQKGSKKGGLGRKRSMSASSQSSRKSFRATRKRPSLTMDGPTDIELSKFRPNGAKFLKEIRRPNAGMKL